jgi:hypothetical protein
MKALSAGCGTYVDNVIALSRTGSLSHQHGTYILREDKTLHESIQGGQVIII